MIKAINYHLVGFAYSGKTTLAKKLEKYGFVHLSIDELKWSLGFKDAGDDDVPDDVWAEIMAKADRLLLDYLREGKNVANEYAWATRYWRDRSKANAAAEGFKTIFVYLQTPPEEVRRRWLQNCESKVRFNMPKNEFDRMFSEFEPLREDEICISYDWKEDMEEWIEKSLLRA